MKKHVPHDLVRDERMRDALQRRQWDPWRQLKEVCADDATESIGAGIRA
jgi:hypothetical protein